MCNGFIVELFCKPVASLVLFAELGAFGACVISVDKQEAGDWDVGSQHGLANWASTCVGIRGKAVGGRGGQLGQGVAEGHCVTKGKKKTPVTNIGLWDLLTITCLKNEGQSRHDPVMWNPPGGQFWVRNEVQIGVPATGLGQTETNVARNRRVYVSP